MKFIKYIAYFAIVYVLIARPHFTLAKPESATTELPHHVKTQIGTSTKTQLRGC